MRYTRPFRMVLGLLVGFTGAYVAIEAIDRFGTEPGTGERLEVVLGRPDFEAYCGRDNSELVVTPAVRDPIDDDPLGWSCSGPVRGLFSTIAIDIDDVCRVQFEPRARARLFDLDDPNGWRCISDP